ncbi:hypothetical protein GGI35DRAFT_489969 [Trichoderma velutinum]
MAPKATLPVGSLILVTGVSGYISAQIVQQLLDRGYKVRGTVRDPAKSDWLSKDLFATHTASGNFHLVGLKDINDESQVKAAVKDVDGVIHTATPNALDPNPNNVIPETVDLVVNLARAAAAEKSVKAFVYTSTIGAISMLPFKPGFHFDGTNWNDDVRDIAWAPPPYTPERGFPVYVQSKVEAEKAFWKFVEEEKPSFTSNTIVVSTVFGPRLHVSQGGSTAAWLLGIANNDPTALQFFPTSIFVDVRDVALLHIAALLDPTIKSTRLPAWATEFYWDDVLDILRNYQPGKPFPANLGIAKVPLGTADTKQAKKALQEWGGQDDFISLEKGVIDTLKGAPLP